VVVRRRYRTCTMDRIKKRSLLSIASVSAILAVLLVCLSREGGVRHHNLKYAPILRFAKIGAALQHYAWDHNDQLPATLTDLVPRYISNDELSDCVYIGAAGIPSEVIAYQRETKQAANERQILSPGFGVHTVTASELEQLLLGTESPALDRLRRDSVTYYEANLHASLNCYRTKLGSYPAGDNPSVTGALRGRNPAEERFHSSYKEERNSHGEELDPWGSPYWIESDGNRVRVKSAGINRQFDPLSSSQYDDICFTIAGGSVSGDDTKF